MSWSKDEDVDCAEVLQRVYLYIDRELDEGTLTYEQIQHHLDDCGPCLTSFDIDRVVKALVARSCRDQAPAELRARVITRIRELRIEISGT